MLQYFVAQGQTGTIAAAQTVTASTAANKLTAPAGIPVGAIVSISGVAGLTGANGIFVVSAFSAGVYTFTTLSGSAMASTGTYTSGGTITHIGFLTSPLTLDNTVFSSPNPDFTVAFRLESLSPSTGIRAHWQDTADAFAGTDTRSGPFIGTYGGQSIVAGARFSAKRYDWPGARLGNANNALRVEVFVEGQYGVAPAVGSTIQFSAWVEA